MFGSRVGLWGFWLGSDLFHRGLHTRIAVARQPYVSWAFLSIFLDQIRPQNRSSIPAELNDGQFDMWWQIFGKYFWAKYHVKFGNFVIFSGKCHKNWHFLSGKYQENFGHFVNFSCIIFGQKCLVPPKVDWAPSTPMRVATAPNITL